MDDWVHVTLIQEGKNEFRVHVLVTLSLITLVWAREREVSGLQMERPV